MGVSLLDEIKKIVMLAYKISATEYKDWTYMFEFEKTINKKSHRTDLVITIKRNHQIMWYVLVENEMSATYKKLRQQVNNRWVNHFRENTLRTNDNENDKVLWVGFTLNNPKTEPAASKMICRLSPALKVENLLNHRHLIQAIHSNCVDENVFAYGLVVLWGSSDVIEEVQWTRNWKQTKSLEKSRELDRFEYPTEGGLEWIRGRVDFLKLVNNTDTNELWMQQYGMCAYCDSLLHPPSGEGVSIMSPYNMRKNPHSSEKIHIRYGRNNFNAGLGLCVASILNNEQSHVLVCCECNAANSMLMIPQHMPLLVGLDFTVQEKIIEKERDLVQRISLESNLTCVQSMYIFGKHEEIVQGEFRHYRICLSVFVTNVTHSKVITITLPFKACEPTKYMMHQITSTGLFIRNNSFSVQHVLTSDASTDKLGMMLAPFFAALSELPLDVAHVTPFFEHIRQKYESETIRSPVPEQFFMVNFKGTEVMMISDIHVQNIEHIYDTVAQIGTETGPMFFSINNNEYIYRLISVYSIAKKQSCWIRNLTHNTIGNPWVDGDENQWSCGASSKTQKEIISVIGEMDNDVFCNVYQCVRTTEIKNQSYKPTNIADCQQHRISMIMDQALELKKNNSVTDNEGVRMWCVLTKLMGSIMYHRFCLIYDVQINQNIFLFLYWTAFIIYSGFDGDEGEILAIDKILQSPISEWEKNTIHTNELFSRFTDYLQNLVQNANIKSVFGRLILKFNDTPHTLSRNIRDLCVLESQRGLVESGGYTPLRNFLLVHYLSCVLQCKKVEEYSQGLHDITTGSNQEQHINQQIQHLYSLEDCSHLQMCTQDDPRPQKSTDSKKNQPIKLPEPPEPIQKHDSTLPDDTDKRKKNTMHKTIRAKRRVLIKMNKFAVNELVVVRIDLKKYSTLMSNVIGPFKITKIFAMGKEKYVYLEIPKVLKINKKFDFGALRAFKKSDDWVDVAPESVDGAFEVAEILAYRKNHEKDTLVLWAGYSVDWVTWEPKKSMQSLLMTKFDDRQEDEEDMDPLGIHKSANI